MMNQDSQLYELVYLLKNTGKEEDSTENIANIRAIIQKLKGIIMEETAPKEQGLSYAILKNNVALISFMRFLSTKESIEEIIKNISKTTNIIRSLVVKVEQRKPSKMKKQMIYKKKTNPIKQEQIKEIDKKLEEILNK